MPSRCFGPRRCSGSIPRTDSALMAAARRRSPSRSMNRRRFLKSAAALPAVAGALAACATRRTGGRSFLTRGAVVVVRDMETLDWPALAHTAGLTTLATHIRPAEIAAFLGTEVGHRFLEGCRRHRLEVEHELHALGDLLPRSLFERNPEMFRMDTEGRRVPEANLCVHSAPALEVVAANAAKYTGLLRSTTGRYFYWIDDAMPLCRCPKCRPYSDSDQALILENHVLRAIRRVDPRARLAHLAYANTLPAPRTVRPEPGIFLEFAPIERRYDVPFGRRDARSAMRSLTHGELLDALDANLAWFGTEGAQALEYWLDVSRFAGWNRDRTVPIPWRSEVFEEDLDTYARRGIRHITTFAAWLDADYARRHGTVPVLEYGRRLRDRG